MSDDEENLERPPPHSLEDAEDDGEDTPAKKRIKSDICGATLEDGRPCPSRAAYGNRWKGDGYRCRKHGGGFQCWYEKDGVRCEKLALPNGLAILYCYKHQAAAGRCVDCGAAIEHSAYLLNDGKCTPCHRKDSERGKELSANLGGVGLEIY